MSIWERTPWQIRWVIAAICNVYYRATRSPIRMTHWIYKEYLQCEEIYISPYPYAGMTIEEVDQANDLLKARIENAKSKFKDKK